MLKTALPYYKKGRDHDPVHLKIIIPLAEKIIPGDKLDESIIMPAVIFHDIGWSLVSIQTKRKFHNKKSRLEHMARGAKLTQKLLKQQSYPNQKIKKIVRLIAVHDNLSQGVGKKLTTRNEYALAVIDFLWRVTKPGFAKDLKELKAKKQTPQKLIQELKQTAKKRRIGRYRTAHKIFKKLLRERQKECHIALKK